MRTLSSRAIWLVPLSIAWIGPGSVRGQTASEAPAAGTVIPLEVAPLPLEHPADRPMPPPSPPTRPAVGQVIRPTGQRLDFRGMGGNAALRQLQNPFEGSCGPVRRGLFGRVRPPRSPAPVVPMAPWAPGPAASQQAPAVAEGHGPAPEAVAPGPAEAPGAAPPPAEAPAPKPTAEAPVPVPPPAEAPAPKPTAEAPVPVPPPAEAPAPRPTAEAPVPVPPPAEIPAPRPAEAPTPAPGEAPTPAPAALPIPGEAAAPGEAVGGGPAGAGTPGAAGAGAAPSPAPGAGAVSAADLFGGGGETAGAGFGGTAAAAPAPFAMIGDISPIILHPSAATPPIPPPIPPPGPPRPPGARGASPIYPSVRNFKVSENQSPRPQDRFFFNFNYYNNLGDAINSRDLSPVTQMKAYVYNFGVEKTFNNGMGSIGIRLPLDNLTANSFGNIVSTPTSTALGNLTVFGKYILAQNPRTGSLVSALLAISPRTGTSRFAGAPYLFPLNSTYIQPCLGYIYNSGRFYFQGFSGFSFPASPYDTSLVYNDVAIGYYLYRNRESRTWLTALAPTFELHVNNPINHRDVFSRTDLAGAPDTVDLTFGLNFGIRNTSVLTAAFVAPVTSPRVFDSEAVLMLNIFYGRTRARLIPITPPPL